MTRRSKVMRTIKWLVLATSFNSIAYVQLAVGQSLDLPTLAASVVETNPEIEAQRAAVRALEARVQTARAGFLPNVEANGLVQRRRLNLVGTTTGDTSFTAGQAEVTARLRLYDGNRTGNAIDVAKEELEAGRAILAGTISDVLLDLLRTSADVRRDRQVQLYAQTQFDSIGEQLRATSRRLTFGEATRTDENQAKARLATSRAGILSASEDLSVSSSEFESVSGHPALEVPELPRLAALPASLEEAMTIALEKSQRLLSSKRTADAARQGVDFARGALAPQVDLVAGYEYLTGGVANLFTGRLPQDRSAAFGGIELRVPIFQGGREYAEIRRSQALRDQRISQVGQTQRSVTYEVMSSWARWKAAVATIDAAGEAVAANERAAEGVAKEAVGGARTTLDVLNAQNELLNARVTLERAVRNEYVARASVLAVIGKLDLQSIASGN